MSIYWYWTQRWILFFSIGILYSHQVNSPDEIERGTPGNTSATPSIDVLDWCQTKCYHVWFDFHGMLLGFFMSTLAGLVVLCFVSRNKRQKGSVNVKFSSISMTDINQSLSYSNIDEKKRASNLPSSLLLNKTYNMDKINSPSVESDYQTLVANCREIDCSQLRLGPMVAQGRFGDIFSANFTESGTIKKVVVKALSTDGDREDSTRLNFLKEALLMCPFHHENVISLVGVVTVGKPVMMVVECAEYGPLDVYLRSNEGQCSVFDLQEFIQQIASGMQYLSTRGYVHRYLTATNVLVNSRRVCKISKFRMTVRGGPKKDIENAAWSAPEVLGAGEYSTASDVWSFGIVCWEIFSDGKRPYAEWSNKTIIEYVRKGYRMKVPVQCPKPMGNLIMNCWEEDWARRPSFSAVVSTLNDYGQRMTIAVEIQRIFEWLTALDLTCYLPHFLKGGVVSRQLAFALTVEDMCRMGILNNHQDIIIGSISLLKNSQSCSSYSHVISKNI